MKAAFSFSKTSIPLAVYELVQSQFNEVERCLDFDGMEPSARDRFKGQLSKLREAKERKEWRRLRNAIRAKLDKDAMSLIAISNTYRDAFGVYNWLTTEDEQARRNRRQALKSYPMLSRQFMVNAVTTAIDNGHSLKDALNSAFGITKGHLNHLRNVSRQRVGRGVPPSVIEGLLAKLQPELFPRSQSDWKAIVSAVPASTNHSNMVVDLVHHLLASDPRPFWKSGGWDLAAKGLDGQQRSSILDSLRWVAVAGGEDAVSRFISGGTSAVNARSKHLHRLRHNAGLAVGQGKARLDSNRSAIAWTGVIEKSMLSKLHLEFPEVTIQELLTPSAVFAEGEKMRHCVADFGYMGACLDGWYRLIHLSTGTGSKGATLGLRCGREQDYVEIDQVQGVENTPPEKILLKVSDRIEYLVNQRGPLSEQFPEIAESRREAEERQNKWKKEMYLLTQAREEAQKFAHECYIAQVLNRVHPTSDDYALARRITHTLCEDAGNVFWPEPEDIAFAA